MPDEIAIAVVGLGLVGRRHAKVLQETPGLALIGVVDPAPEAEAIAASLKVPCFATLEALFDQRRPDGVVLATPTPLHQEQALEVIQRGCPVLIEKPITVTSDEARILTAAADKADVPVLVGHHRRHNGMVRAAKAALQQGRIGKIRAVQMTCWLYKPDSYFDTAPWRKRPGAGPISVNLVHDVDLLRHFCGEVTTVQAAATPAMRGYDNEDLASAILTFDSGVVATISVSDSIAAPWSYELTARENPAYPATGESCYLIGGSEGALSLPDLRIWQHQPAPDWWSPMTAEHLQHQSDDPLVAQMQHFARVIRGAEAPLVSGIEGMRSLEVVEAVSRAAATGRPVTLGTKTQ